MAVQLDPALDAALMAISAMAAGVSPASPTAPATSPPERGDSFRGALQAEENRNGAVQQERSGRDAAQALADDGATARAGTEDRAPENGEAATKTAPTRQAGGASVQDPGATARAEGAARFQTVFQNGLPVEALDLKGVLVARATETRAPVIGLQAEQIALEKLGGDRAQPAADGPATIRLPQPQEKEAPLFKPVAAGDRKSDPQANDSPARDASAEAVRRDGQAEPRPEATATARPPQEAKLLPHPIPVTVVDAPLRAAPVQAPLASSASTQLQEIRDKVLARIESGVQVLLDRGEGRMTLRLQPPELGKVLVEVQPGDRGMEIKLSTESLAVREVVLGGLEQLKSNLQAAGLEVNALSVEVNAFRDPFTRSQTGDGDGRRRGGAGGGGGEGGGADPGDTAATILPVNLSIGRRVNLLA